MGNVVIAKTPRFGALAVLQLLAAFRDCFRSDVAGRLRPVAEACDASQAPDAAPAGRGSRGKDGGKGGKAASTVDLSRFLVRSLTIRHQVRG